VGTWSNPRRVCAAAVMATSIEKFLPISMRYFAVSSLLMSFDLISRRKHLALPAKSFFEKEFDTSGKSPAYVQHRKN
jgi:hypothetical protein